MQQVCALAESRDAGGDGRSWEEDRAGSFSSDAASDTTVVQVAKEACEKGIELNPLHMMGEYRPHGLTQVCSIASCNLCS